MPPAENLSQPALLTKDHDRNAFDYGVPALNEYLKKYALQNQKKHAARTYVATRGDRIVGYYSLAYGSVSLEEAPQSVRSGLPRHPIPVILLARLAVDSSEQGRGLGPALLKDALLRTIQAAEILLPRLSKFTSQLRHKLGCTPYVRQKVKTLPWPIEKGACFRLGRC